MRRWSVPEHKMHDNLSKIKSVSPKTIDNPIEEVAIEISGFSSGYHSEEVNERERNFVKNNRSNIEIINVTPLIENHEEFDQDFIKKFISGAYFPGEGVVNSEPVKSEEEIEADHSSTEVDNSDSDPDWVPESKQKKSRKHLSKYEINNYEDSDSSEEEKKPIKEKKPKSQKIQRSISKSFKNPKSKFYFQLTEDHMKIVSMATAYSDQRTNCRLEMWQFLLFLLNHSHDNGLDLGLQWISEKEATFRISNTKKLAALWGIHQDNPKTTYEAMSRNLRYYYATKVLKKHSERLSYQFYPASCEWYSRTFR